MQLKQLFKLKLFFIVLFIIGIFAVESFAAEESFTTKSVVSEQTSRCIQCHISRNKRIIENWETSIHAKNGVGCYECHNSKPGDPATKPGHSGFNVSLIVTPARCGECHAEQYKSFASSTHVMAFDLLTASATQSIKHKIFKEKSCYLCHGNKVKMKRGKPVGHTWPNYGIGRINPDGSRGTCTACHTRHNFSMAKVRSAETCGRCHYGNESPAFEAWKASSHGLSFDMANEKVDFTRRPFHTEKEKVMAPNCFVCHLAATGGNQTTHDPSERLSWKLAAFKSKRTKGWGKKRRKMQNACKSCHGATQVKQFYKGFDACVNKCNKISKMLATDSAKLKEALIKMKLGAAMLSPKHIADGLKELE